MASVYSEYCSGHHHLTWEYFTPKGSLPLCLSSLPPPQSPSVTREPFLNISCKWLVWFLPVFRAIYAVVCYFLPSDRFSSSCVYNATLPHLLVAEYLYDLTQEALSILPSLAHGVSHQPPLSPMSCHLLLLKTRNFKEYVEIVDLRSPHRVCCCLFGKAPGLTIKSAFLVIWSSRSLCLPCLIVS